MTVIEDSTNNYTQPLYIRIPIELHEYLDNLKEETGISKSDIVTLILVIARRLVDPKAILELFDDYMLRGDDGLDFTVINTLNDSQ